MRVGVCYVLFCACNVLLFVVCCAWFAVWCLLRVVRCALFVACSVSLLVVCCLSFGVCCKLLVSVVCRLLLVDVRCCCVLFLFAVC